MAQLRYGSVVIYHDEVLGVGSYGKVCVAKYSQLPCAAKLLHDTMFETGDPGRFRFAERFEEECHLLSMVKHPNIVQHLSTCRDPKSQRLCLLMELMDESLTKLLERSPGPLSYHIQLNICHDVALALSYLHFNDIIHRDLSSNNVLLIGEGSRAKVTDFGMSKLIDANPCMTPLTQCPGTSVYMPPEALISPPQYSSKLDCFSHGVLTIQLFTRRFPAPGAAHKLMQDPNYSDHHLFYQVPEKERRQKDIELFERDHPLLPTVFNCIENNATKRPSADEICERLAVLKKEEAYKHSIECANEKGVVQKLQEELLQKDNDHQVEKAKQQEKVACKDREHQEELKKYQDALSRERNIHLSELQSRDRELKSIRLKVRALQDELEEQAETIKKLRKESMPVKREAAWICDYCTFINSSGAKCEVCGMKYSNKGND